MVVPRAAGSLPAVGSPEARNEIKISRTSRVRSDSGIGSAPSKLLSSLNWESSKGGGRIDHEAHEFSAVAGLILHRLLHAKAWLQAQE